MDEHVANATITSVNVDANPRRTNYTVRLDEGGGIETVERPSWVHGEPHVGTRVEIAYSRSADGQPPCAHIAWLER